MSKALSWRTWQMDELGSDADRQRILAHRAKLKTEVANLQVQLVALQSRLQELREQAQREGWQAGYEAGHQEGLAKGLEEGRRSAEEENQRLRRELLEPLKGLAGEFNDALAQLDEEMAADLTELALTVGRQLAGEALEAQPQQVAALVRTLLREEPLFNGGSRLWLHPEDLQLVEDELKNELSVRGWQVRPDPRLSRGGCRVTGPAGELDATFETRWNQLRERVYRRFRKREADGEQHT